LDLHEVKEARAQRILLDGVKDHLIPHLVEKKAAKEMWDALTKLYPWYVQGVTSYLTRLTRVRDELAAVGDIILEEELVHIALNGFGKQWDVFVKCVVGREKIPTWERLWDDFTQEEI
jgi:hypothetical protein